MSNDRIKAALASDQLSQVAYTGRVAQKEIIEVFTEDGTPIQKEVTIYISWDSIVEILAMINKRAGL